jgi:hypothetical protein
MSPVSLPYPAHREADVALPDGSTVHIRPVRPGDRDAVLAFLQGLSDESRLVDPLHRHSNMSHRWSGRQGRTTPRGACGRYLAA